MYDVCIHICVYERICVICEYMYGCMYVCMHNYIYVSMYESMYI